MSDALYSRLAEALDRLPGRFPSTPSGAEVPLLRRLFTPEQAELGAVMGRDFEDAATLAARVGSPAAVVEPRLEDMVEGGLALAAGSEGTRAYRLDQFLDGIIERWADRLDGELATLFEAYMDDGGARVIMGARPAYARVLPSAKAIRAEWVLPYDDVRAVIEQTRSIVLNDCFCRAERALAGSPCRFPTHVCLDLRSEPPPPGSTVISADEALGILHEAETAGLVHTVSNVLGSWKWLCNCCSCCCEFLRGYTHWQTETAVVRNYRVRVDEAPCTGCGVCEHRCQVAAIAVSAEVAVADTERCIGCGLCVTTCPEGALELERLPEADITLPPKDIEAWEDERQRVRSGG